MAYNIVMRYRVIDQKAWQRRNKNQNENRNTLALLTIEDIERFCGRIVKGQGCWGFTSKQKAKYFRFKTLLAHRIAYELFIGRIPDGQTLDHLCLNTRCINPKHLEPASVLENSKRYIAYQRYGVSAVPQYAI